jgi:hypothetical protein
MRAFAASALCLWIVPAHAALPAQCVLPSWPSAPPLSYSPTVAVGAASDFMGYASAAICHEWDSQRFPQVAVIRGLIAASNARSLLERLGAISQFAGMRYWSVTDRRLEVLITSAFAVEPVKQTEARPDYSPQEMLAGQELKFSEHDNRLPDAVIYRMRITEHDEHHFVIDMSNLTPVKRLLFTLFSPGDLRTVLFVSEAGPGVWICYGVSGVHASSLARLVENPKSQLNRLIAFYGHLAGSDPDTLPWDK